MITKPFFTISKSVALEKYAEVELISDVVSYSSKTNPVISGILEQETDCLFSIHMPNELKNISDKSRVLFLVQAWDDDVMKGIFESGVRRFAVDNEPDLNNLLRFITKHKYTLDLLLLRVKLKERSLKTERNFVFGMDSSVVNKRVSELKDSALITHLGVHFHRKTQNLSEWNLSYELNQMFTQETFSSISYMNIGGGLPSVYANTNKDVIELVQKQVLELKVFLNEKEIKLLLEPGRFIAAPAGKLHTQITGLYEQNIIVNASIYNSDMDAVIVPVKLLIENEVDKSEDGAQAYIVKGSTPCSVDLFRYRVYLIEPKVGDDLVFINAGAYNFSSDFCDLDTLETKVVD